MDDVLKALKLLAYWYNVREELSQMTSVRPEDFKLISFDHGEDGFWSVTATNRFMGQAYFMVHHDGTTGNNNLYQYRLVSEAMFNDEVLNDNAS
jgi:hypothetical protein